MVLYWGLSVSLFCWQTGHSVVAVARSAMLLSLCMTLSLSPWPLCSWAHWVMMGLTGERGWLVLCEHAKSLQLCTILCDPRDCSPPDSSVHGILQARILEWVAMPSSRGIFPTQGLNLGLLHCRRIIYQMRYQGNPGSYKKGQINNGLN